MLKHRLVTGIAVGLFFIIVILFAPWQFLPAIGLVVFYLAITEFREMLDASGLRMELALSLIFGMLYLSSVIPETNGIVAAYGKCGLVCGNGMQRRVSDLILMIAPAFFLCSGVLRRKTDHAVECFALSLAGFWYTALLLSFMFRIMFDVPSVHFIIPDLKHLQIATSNPEPVDFMTGRLMLLYFIVLVKMSDIGAYALGMTFGKGGRKLIPEISPGKSVVGLGGAYLGSLFGSMIVYSLARAFGGGCLGNIRLTITHALVLPLIMASTGVMGDLAESLFKRSLKVKDSSSRFPGMGGILDILDSILFSAPFFYIYMMKFMIPGLAGGIL